MTWGLRQGQCEGSKGGNARGGAHGARRAANTQGGGCDFVLLCLLSGSCNTWRYGVMVWGYGFWLGLGDQQFR